MTDQNVKLPYDPSKNYREESNLTNLSLRGLMDLLTALGSKEADELQNMYRRDTRTLRHELTTRIKSIFDADSSFSFEEDEVPTVAATTIAVAETLADDLVSQSAEVAEDSDEDPLMARILDLADDSTTEEDAMEFVTEQIDGMDRAALIEHAEKYVQVSDSFGDFSTHDMRQTLLEHYQNVQESLADAEDDEEMSESVTADLESFSEEAEENFDPDSDEVEHDFSEFQETEENFDPDEEEDPDADSEFTEDSSHEDDEEFEIEDQSNDEDGEDFEIQDQSNDADDEEFDEDSAIMDRIESSNYLLHSNLPHAELQTSSRILVKVHAMNIDLGDLSSYRDELESTYSSNEIVYDMRTPLRSTSMAERNERNVGWFYECLPSIARVLAEFNSVNRSYVGDIRSLQQTIHMIQQNLDSALNAVILNTAGQLQLPEGMDIDDFYRLDVQPNTLESDTEVTFDVVLNLLVPMLADLAPAKFEQSVNAIASQINKAIQTVADDTESYLDVAVHFAASMEAVINNDSIREFFAEVPHYTANELYAIAEESEENFSREYDELNSDDEDTDEHFEETNEVENSDEESDDQFASDESNSEASSMLLDLCSTFSGLTVVTNWTTNIVSDDLL